MNQGRTLFAQLLDLAPPTAFRRCVERYEGNHRVRSLNLKRDLYTILQILSVTLFERIEIFQALSSPNYSFVNDHACNQLLLFNF